MTTATKEQCNYIKTSQAELEGETVVEIAIGLSVDVPEGIIFRETVFARSQFPLPVQVPGCQTVTIYLTPESLPAVDVPCPCGNPTHWLVKFYEPKR